MSQRILRMLALFSLGLGACADKYPPCELPPFDTDSKGEYVPPAPTPGSGPAEPPPSSYPSGGELAADDHGYMNAPDGSGICKCSAADAKAHGCDVDPDAEAAPPPSGAVAKDGICDFRNTEGDPDCALPGTTAEPQTPSICGEVYWCCASIMEYTPSVPGLLSGKSTMYKDIPLCGYGSRHTTFHRWLLDLMATFAVKGFLPYPSEPPKTGGVMLVTANCFSNPRGSATCGNYPDGEAP